jgi:hypothetical protein
LLGKIALRVVDVMNKDICCVSAHVEVVVVVAGDGEVPHPPVVDGRDRAADHHGRLAVWRLEMHARFEVICRNPAVVRIRVPEQVTELVWMTAVP